MTKKELREKLNGFYESDAGKMTVKELLTSTSNVILPTMVHMRAILELGIWSGLRDVALQVRAPSGAEKVINTQLRIVVFSQVFQLH